jgi:uncharacterized Zn-binding protein involved in type VI secretion
MAQLSRLGDQNTTGGKIVRGASTTYANGIAVGLHVSDITPHAPFGKPHPPHKSLFYKTEAIALTKLRLVIWVPVNLTPVILLDH